MRRVSFLHFHMINLKNSFGDWKNTNIGDLGLNPKSADKFKDLYKALLFWKYTTNLYTAMPSIA